MHKEFYSALCVVALDFIIPLWYNIIIPIWYIKGDIIMDDKLKAAKEAMETISSLVTTVARENEAVKSSGFDPENIFKIELMFFLMYLSASDGIIDKEESKIISFLCDTNLQPYEINELINNHNIYSREYENRIPLSLTLLISGDTLLWNIGNKESAQGSEFYISILKEFGMLIVKSNGDNDIDKMNSLRNYISNLEKYREDNFIGASSITGLIKN